MLAALNLGCSFEAPGDLLKKLMVGPYLMLFKSEFLDWDSGMRFNILKF